MKKTEDWLYDLGYDAREELDEEGVLMAAFMREVRKEQLLEASLYIEEIEDVSDDYYIRMKNGEIKRK